MFPNVLFAGLRLRGVDYSESSSTRYQGPASGGSDDWRDTTKRVNNQLDSDLGEGNSSFYNCNSFLFIQNLLVIIYFYLNFSYRTYIFASYQGSGHPIGLYFLLMLRRKCMFFEKEDGDLNYSVLRYIRNSAMVNNLMPDG